MEEDLEAQDRIEPILIDKLALPRHVELNSNEDEEYFSGSRIFHTLCSFACSDVSSNADEVVNEANDSALNVAEWMRHLLFFLTYPMPNATIKPMFSPTLPRSTTTIMRKMTEGMK